MQKRSILDVAREARAKKALEPPLADTQASPAPQPPKAPKPPRTPLKPKGPPQPKTPPAPKPKKIKRETWGRLPDGAKVEAVFDEQKQLWHGSLTVNGEVFVGSKYSQVGLFHFLDRQYRAFVRSKGELAEKT